MFATSSCPTMNYAPSASADPSDWTMTRLYDDGAETRTNVSPQT